MSLVVLVVSWHISIGGQLSSHSQLMYSMELSYWTACHLICRYNNKCQNKQNGQCPKPCDACNSNECNSRHDCCWWVAGVP
jgi:hypothetical protein